MSERYVDDGPFDPHETDRLTPEQERFYTASQWQLIWWRFCRHKLALVSLWFLAILYASTLVTEIVAPYDLHTRNARYIYAPPQRIRLFHEGSFVGPFVYGYAYKLDMANLRRIYSDDRTKVQRLRFFCRGDPYRFWGRIESDWHLVCPAENGTLFLAGTDRLGRDVLSRMIYGSRNSLIFGILSPFLAAIFGTTLGVIAGYFGGLVDRLISRVIDLLLAFPELLLAIMIAAVLGGGFWNIVAVLTVAFVPGFARVARASTLAVKQEPFVEAAVAVGVSTPVIIFRHIVPNISAPIVVLMTLWVASAIRLEASLSFLGIGTQPPNPSWGNIIRDGLNNLFGSPWPLIGAGFAITCVVLAFNLVGDAVRDVLDPETAQ